MSSYKGFTILELLVTVAVVGVLASIAHSAYDNYKRRAIASNGKVLVSGLFKMYKTLLYERNVGTLVQKYGNQLYFPAQFKLDSFTEDFYDLACPNDGSVSYFTTFLSIYAGTGGIAIQLSSLPKSQISLEIKHRWCNHKYKANRGATDITSWSSFPLSPYPGSANPHMINPNRLEFHSYCKNTVGKTLYSPNAIFCFDGVGVRMWGDKTIRVCPKMNPMSPNPGIWTPDTCGGPVQ